MLSLNQFQGSREIADNIMHFKIFVELLKKILISTSGNRDLMTLKSQISKQIILPEVKKGIS